MMEIPFGAKKGAGRKFVRAVGHRGAALIAAALLGAFVLPAAPAGATTSAPTVSIDSGSPLQHEPISTGTITTGSVGNLVVVVVKGSNKTATVKQVTDSGSRVSWASSAVTGSIFSTPTVSATGAHLEIWWGTVTSAGTTKVAVTWTGSPTGVATPWIETAVFHASTMTTYTWKAVGGTHASAATGSLVPPSLTSTATAVAQVYFGKTEAQTSSSTGGTAGFTYYTDGHGNEGAYEVNLAKSTGYAPQFTGTGPRMFSGAIFGLVSSAVTPAGTSAQATVSVSPGSLAFTSAPSGPAWSYTDNGLGVAHLPMTGTTEALDVNDARGTGAGWSVTLSTTPFKTTATGAHSLSTTAVSVQTAPAAYTCDATDVGGCKIGSNTVVYPYSVPAATPAPAATAAVSAAVTTGMGAQTVQVPFVLTIPSDAYAGTYSSTWTFTLVSGP